MKKQPNRYWYNKGKYQKEYEAVCKLVPDSGMADTIEGEVVRNMTNAYYDLYNNGGCNERLDDLRLVYDFLHKHDIEHDHLGTIDYGALYNNCFVFDVIAERVEKLADAVFLTVYKVTL